MQLVLEVTIALTVLFSAPLSYGALIDELSLYSPHLSRLESECIRFLIDTMPVADLSNPVVTMDFLIENTQYALRAKEMTAWGRETPWPIFLNEVLPYAILTEPRERWRAALFDRLVPIISPLTNGTDAAIQMNLNAYKIVDPPIVFVAAPPNELNHYSVFEVMKAHNASCTGLSIFLVAALRTVGIPARIAGVAHWNKGKVICPNGDADPPCGNHNWVEVYIDGGWNFIDQDSGSQTLNSGWFYPEDTNYQVPHSANHSIYASSWSNLDYLNKMFYPKSSAISNYKGHFPLAWDWNNTSVHGWDVTNLYKIQLEEVV